MMMMMMMMMMMLNHSITSDKYIQLVSKHRTRLGKSMPT